MGGWDNFLGLSYAAFVPVNGRPVETFGNADPDRPHRISERQMRALLAAARAADAVASGATGPFDLASYLAGFAAGTRLSDPSYAALPRDPPERSAPLSGAAPPTRVLSPAVNPSPAPDNDAGDGPPEAA